MENTVVIVDQLEVHKYFPFENIEKKAINFVTNISGSMPMSLSPKKTTTESPGNADAMPMNMVKAPGRLLFLMANASPWDFQPTENKLSVVCESRHTFLVTITEQPRKMIMADKMDHDFYESKLLAALAINGVTRAQTNRFCSRDTLQCMPSFFIKS